MLEAYLMFAHPNHNNNGTAFRMLTKKRLESQNPIHARWPNLAAAMKLLFQVPHLTTTIQVLKKQLKKDIQENEFTKGVELLTVFINQLHKAVCRDVILIFLKKYIKL